MKNLVQQQLFTSRLILRSLRLSDDQDILALRTDPEVNRFVDRTPYTTLDQSRQFISHIEAEVGQQRSCYWAITRRNSDRLIGCICLWNFSADRLVAEVGFELMPSHQGAGYMTEALKAVTTFAFEQCGLKAIEGYVKPGNQRSIAVLEKQGFRKIQEGDEIVLALNQD
ncbi:GNAT family N-acetyltransferase [Chitinophaga vietnamensis]|uniref:GNAT family N-acetyltransferase n=1 Tax=Chitinophaga vietnamensis TaxID=2593957 RepID=UPI001375A286|nr:GNAT family N-acetyltransferase [Chitinophaga vietnamensis]